MIFTLSSVGLILFIFSNSLLDASKSTVQSAGVREFINSIFTHLGINFQFSENFIRKSAHFAEYFALSVSMFFMFVSYLDNRNKTLFFTLSCGLLTACIDESIQLFSDGRSAQITDVILDFSAVVIAACILYFIFLKIRSKRGNFKNE